MKTIEIFCTEDEKTEVLIKPSDETSDLFICVNNEYAYISKEKAIFVANEIIKHYEKLKEATWSDWHF